MKMATDHFVESMTRLGIAEAAKVRNSIHLLAGVQMTYNRQVLNRLRGYQLQDNKDEPVELANDMHHRQKYNLLELQPLEPLASEVDIRSHSITVEADNIHHYRVDHSKVVDIVSTMLQLMSSVATTVSLVLRKRSCVKLINNNFN